MKITAELQVADCELRIKQQSSGREVQVPPYYRRGLAPNRYAASTLKKGTTTSMGNTLTETTRRRLDIQGFERVENEKLAQVSPWLRLSFGLCAALSGIGTALTSTTLLWILVPIALLAVLFPVHPFDLIYNFGIRHFTGTPPLPRRGAPNRFACALAVAFLLGTIWAFESGNFLWGYVIGGSMTAVAILVSTTDICIPSLMYRVLFGFPKSA